MTRDQAKDKLRRFITGELMGVDDYDLANDEPLVGGGLIDSFSLVHIAVFMEREFGVYVPDSEVIENFDTIDQIVARIDSASGVG